MVEFSDLFDDETDVFQKKAKVGKAQQTFDFVFHTPQLKAYNPTITHRKHSIVKVAFDATIYSAFLVTRSNRGLSRTKNASGALRDKLDFTKTY